MEVDDAVAEKVRGMVDRLPKTIAHHVGIEFEVLGKDRVVGTMPVDYRTMQPFGLLHGGASVVLAETLASIGAWLSLTDPHSSAVGVEINANHLRAVKGGRVRGEARPIHRGRSTHVWAIEIVDQDGALVCVSRITLMIKGE